MTNAARDEAALADVKWLNDLTASLSDEQYARLRSYLASAPITDEMRDHGITAEMMKGWFGFEGTTLLSELTRLAVTNLPSAIDYPGTPIDLMFLYPSIPTLNGFAIRTPHLSAAAVVLNHGLVTYVAAAVHLMLGLTTWSDTPYCVHHSDEARLQGLVDLAMGIHEKNPVLPLAIEGIDCIGTPDHEQYKGLYESMCVLAELFVIFHELGHTTLGHLDPNDVTFSFGPTAGPPVAVFNRSQQNEFDADLYSYQQLVRTFVRDDGLRERDVLYAIGCLLALSETVERITPGWQTETHPPARLRWSTLTQRLTEARVSAHIDTIDYFFAWTANGGLSGPAQSPSDTPAPEKT